MLANEYLSLAEAEKITGISQDYFKFVSERDICKGKNLAETGLLKRST